MSIAEADPWQLYLLILAAYAPGLYAIIRLPRLAAMPVITFTFLGMFLFTAAGSILIITRPHFALGSLLSGQYVGMLLLQAVAFYLIAGPYVLWRKVPVGEQAPVAPEDFRLRNLMLLGTLVVLAAYYAQVGRFPVFDLVAGRINRVNILEYRTITYGLPGYPFFRLGFFVLPALACALTIATASARGFLTRADSIVIGLCLIPPLLLAEKAAILHVSVVILAAYISHVGMRGKTVLAVLHHKSLLVMAAAFIPTIAVYLIYFNGNADSIRSASEQFVFRIIGVYSEAMAATVPFVEQHGHLGGITMPNLKGLFPHDRFNLEVAMHGFLASGTEYDAKTALAGASPVPATAEGYVNFGWPGFIGFSVVAFGSVVAFQEILLRLQRLLGALGFALASWYSYLGFTLFTTSIFATFISLIHSAVALTVLITWFALRWFSKRRRPASGWNGKRTR